MKTFRIGKKEFTVLDKDEKLDVLRKLCGVKSDLEGTIHFLELEKIRHKNNNYCDKFFDLVCDCQIRFLEESLEECNDISKKLIES